MTSIDKFLVDEQDPKAVEKVLGKLTDLLSANEELIYMAVQKKPAVNLLPDCIVVSNRRIFYCEPSNFGITMNFKDISWKNIKEVSFKEEFFGSKFICVPQTGENIVTEYIPKVQARKLYQVANEQLDTYKEEHMVDQKPPIETPSEPIKEVSEYDAASPVISPLPIDLQNEVQEDEITQKLRKLKTLFDKQLITLEEYEAKKAGILDSL